MKLADIEPIIKAIKVRQENAEDLPPLTEGDFLRMLREASEPKTGGIQLIIREDGTAEQYDDTYDLTIHCTSEDEQREVLRIMEAAAKLMKAKPHGALIDRDAFKADYGMADECRNCKSDPRSCEFDRNYTKMDFCGWLDDAPVIIERSEGT